MKNLFFFSKLLGQLSLFLLSEISRGRDTTLEMYTTNSFLLLPSESKSVTKDTLKVVNLPILFLWNYLVTSN